MRSYHGIGYDKSRRSIATIASVVVALVSVALSTFVLVNRRPAVEPRGHRVPAPATKPVAAPDPAKAPANSPKPGAAEQGPATPVFRAVGEIPALMIVNPKPPRKLRPECHNSTEPACGPFYWSPAPAENKPLRMTVEYFPANPVAGEEVMFRVTVSDGDAKVNGIYAVYGDGTGTAISSCTIHKRYGPWTPPAQEPDEKTVEFRHTYQGPGTYEATFYSSSADCESPYADRARLPAEIVVEPAPESA